ncbi:ATP-binding protein [Nitrincola schmidtii]|uniref:ATP-binding protein n=1 Tax=Nitrincola schmidtii TaxID=1730894 RepID=UPI00124F0FE9|nr:ATP-binding protein [Nitrincola schmidtii]
MKSLFKNDIRERVLFLSIFPMLAITLFLGSFFIYTQVENAEQGMIEKGQEFSQLLAAAAEFGILSNNPAELAPLSQQLIKNPLVIDVIFTDQDLLVIHREDVFDVSLSIPPDPTSRTAQEWLFSHPVKPMPIRTLSASSIEDKSSNEDITGWVIIVFSDEPIRQQQYQIIRNSLFIILAGFLITFLLSNYFGRKISLPVKQLSIIISQLRRGNLSTRAMGSNTEEFNQLAEGINELAKSLEESNYQMENRINQATQALSVSLQELEIKNNQLTKAHQKADSANRAKDAFLARMSHELRTPLTSVIGFTRMIQEGSTEQERAHYLKIIDHTSQMLLTLIDDLLDFTRLESDAIELEFISFHPEKLFHQAIEMQALAAHAKGIELILNGSFKLPELLVGDPTRIRQIITNLIGNAIKFTDRGHIELHTEYFHKQKTLMFSVEDTGIGINENYKNKMFESFTQADNSISRKYGGSGLGLAITSRLIKLMNGHIHVETKSGKGSKFVVTIPVEVKVEPFEIDEIEDFSIRLSDENLNILVIESNTVSRKSISDTFSYHNIACKDVERIEDALNTAEQYSHIIISHAANDHNLELLYRKTESLRQQFPIAKIIILHPATIRRDSLKNFKALSFTKPLSSSQLLKCICNSKELNNSLNDTDYELDSLEILIAEDNDYNRLLVKRILRQAGIKTREVTTGKQAIDEINIKMPDIILMDINMPDMDGIEASKLILEQHPKAQIIALTANISSREQQLLNQIGIGRVLIKPLNIEKLYALLSTLDFRRGKVTSAGTNKSEFEIEIKRQLEEIQSRIYAKDYESLARNAHQLYGFAGLFDHPEIEMVAERLKKAVISRDIRNIWSAYNQLARVVNNLQRF